LLGIDEHVIGGAAARQIELGGALLREGHQSCRRAERDDHEIAYGVGRHRKVCRRLMHRPRRDLLAGRAVDDGNLSRIATLTRIRPRAAASSKASGWALSGISVILMRVAGSITASAPLP
jgi:hypothetical protein